MKICFISLLTILAPVSLLAQEPCLEKRFEAIRGYPVEIEIEDDRLWIADGAGAASFDVSTPWQPEIITTRFERSGEALAVERISETRVAVLTDDAVRLYETSGEHLSLIAEAPVNGVTMEEFSGGLVVVGQTLLYFSLSNDQLVASASIELPGRPSLSRIVDDLLLVAIDDVGTIVFDDDLTQRGRIRSSATAIDSRGRVVFLGRASQGVLAVDLTDPDEPQTLDVTSGIGAVDVAVDGARLLTSDGEGTVWILDASDPTELEVIDSFARDIDLMESHEGYLYAYSWSHDRFGTRFENAPYLSVYDLASLELVGSVGRSTGPLRGVATDGETAWIADPPFVRAIDLSSGEVVWEVEIEEPFTQIRYENGLLILYGAIWVHLVEPAETSGELLGSWPTLGTKGGGVTFSGPWLIEANRASGLHVLDISDPSNIIQRGGLINDTRGQWMDVVGVDGAIYGNTVNGVKVVALGSDPSAVATVDYLRFDTLVDIEIVRVAGTSYLVVLDGSMLHVYDVREPLEPALVATATVPTGIQLSVSEESVWILTHDATAVRVDLSNPSQPFVRQTIDGMRAGLAIDSEGDVVVGADRWALWATALTPIEELDPPVLDSEDLDSRIHLRWAAMPVRSTEVQVAADSSFATIIESRIVGGGSLDIHRRDHEIWVRARYVTSCGAGAWSAALAIGAEESGPGRARAVRRP